MARLDLTPGLNYEQQIQSTHRGQAYFGNTGPFAATCSECVFLGYHRKHFNKTGDVIKATYTGGCEKFYQLTNTHGPVVPGHASACRYFQRKEENQS